MTEKIPIEFGGGRLFGGRDPLGGGKQHVFRVEVNFHTSLQWKDKPFARDEHQPGRIN